MSEMKGTYESRQLDRIEDKSAPFYRMQMYAAVGDGHTHWMNISQAQFAAIREILATVDRPEPHPEDSPHIMLLFAKAQNADNIARTCRELIAALRQKEGLDPVEGIDTGGSGSRSK